MANFYYFWRFVLIYVFYDHKTTKQKKCTNKRYAIKLEKGSEVIAASGILGKVKDISGAYVSIEISENNVIKLQKSAIANILPKGTIDSIK